MKSNRQQRPTIRRLQAKPDREIASQLRERESELRRLTIDMPGRIMTASVGMLTVGVGALSVFVAWQQAQAAMRAPIAQAVAVQQVQGCGQMIRAFRRAQVETVEMVTAYGGGSSEIPMDEAQRVGRSIRSAIEAGEANILFFDMRQQITVGNALAAVGNERFIQNMIDDQRLQGIPAETAGWFGSQIDDPLVRLETMCRLIMYPAA